MMHEPVGADYRGMLADLCHLVQESNVAASMRKACSLFAAMAGGQRAFLFEIEQASQRFRLAAGIDTGDSNYAPSDVRSGIDFRSAPISPLNQVLMQAAPLVLSRNFGGYDMSDLMSLNPRADMFSIVPLRNEQNNIYALLLAGGRAGDHILFSATDRFDALVLSAVGALLDLRLRHDRVSAASMAMSKSMANLSHSRDVLERQNEGRRMRLRGRSHAILQARRAVLRAGRDRENALIIGPRGSRREDAARDIHDTSPNLVGRFVYFDCATPGDRAIPELAGFKRGSIPNVQSARRGLLREASFGVLYFDRIEACDESLRSFLIRLLDTGESRSMGSDRATTVEAKLIFGITAKNGVLPDEPVTAGIQTRIIIPPLSQRHEDFSELLEMALEDATYERTIEISPDVAPYLASLEFTGDLREFNALVARAAAFVGEEAVLNRAHIKAALSGNVAAFDDSEIKGLREAIDDFEKNIIEATLIHAGGNRKVTAEKLGIPKRTLADKCRRYGL